MKEKNSHLFLNSINLEKKNSKLSKKVYKRKKRTFFLRMFQKKY